MSDQSEPLNFKAVELGETGSFYDQIPISVESHKWYLG
jgi:hypothetical protein